MRPDAIGHATGMQATGMQATGYKPAMGMQAWGDTLLARGNSEGKR